MFVLRFLIRTSAFIGKEISEILRQPRLILTLVLGPFLILFLFGIGYHNQARALRTLFVVPRGSSSEAMTQQIQQYATSLGPQLIFAGTTADENAARQALVQNQIDLVVVTPADAYQTIRSNKQATFTLLHSEIDPIQVDYISYFGQVYVNEVNRRVLLSMAEQGQADAASAQQDVKKARDNVAAVRKALQAGDQAGAQQSQQNLGQNIDALNLALGATAGLVGSIQSGSGGANDPPQSGQTGLPDLRSALQGIRQDNEALSSARGDTNTQAQQAAKLDNDLARLDTELTDLRNVDPGVLVQPFNSKAQGIAPVQPTLSGFFAPAVIALLLQHLAVTFAALSIVRERQLGAMELFRVSPVTPFETLLGKYLSYMIFGAFLAAILSFLIIYVLKVPLLGDPRWYVLALAALLFTALGFGFVMSAASQSDSQAVQYAMIMLLASVFFSGFLLSLNNLTPGVRLVSWLLPATYGISLLQNIMLRGYLLQPDRLLILTAMGVVLFFIAWAMLRRRLARS